MYSIISGVCIFLIYSGITIADFNYPSDLPKCHMGDNKCITEVIQLFARNFSDGIPSINLPTIDPLHLGKIDMVRDEEVTNLKDNELLEHINWKNKNVKLYGLKNSIFTITGFEKNLNDSNVILLTIFMPNQTFTADYKLKFKFLQRQIKGQGKLRFEMENVKIEFNFKLKLYENEDGKQYMKIDQPKYDYTLEKVADLNFGTMFNGDEMLSRLEHEFLNENGNLLINVIKTVCGPDFAISFTEHIESVFSKFSIDQLFFIDA